MRFSLFALVRLTLLVVAGSIALAIVLGRGMPKATASRQSEPVRYHAINWYLFRQADRIPRFLDAETGRLTRVGFPGSASLEYASCSPWRDDRGQVQVVGLWNGGSRSGEGCEGLGLARFTFPERRLVECVPIDAMPTGVPCWYPGASPMVLYAATDGHLYRLAFDEQRAGEDDAVRGKTGLDRLGWQCTPPGDGEVQISDPTWPTDPRLGGKLLVSLRTWQTSDPGSGLTRSGIWWVRLCPDGLKIEEAGRLTPAEPDADERWPALGTDPEGHLTLAFMSRPEGTPGWHLRLASVATEGKSGMLRVSRSIAVSRDEACLPTPPVFSLDGRWVYRLSGVEQSWARVDRVSVGATLVLKADPPPPSHLAGLNVPRAGSSRPPRE